MKVYVLPLEPLDKRYTKQWYYWFKETFKRKGINFEYIDGEYKKSELKGKLFLDWRSSFIWKFEQLKRLFKKKLKNSDWILIFDGEFPGIESIEYFKKFYDVDIKVAELWHAGTYDIWDLTYQKGLERIGSKLEEVWFDIADIIFVATNFHKKLIVKNRNVDEDKIKVVGWPIDFKNLRKFEIDWNKRKNRLVFTGRLSIEKGIDVIEELKKKYNIFITQKYELNKEEYYKELANSKGVIAPSRQETFGYGVVEGMAMNVLPIVPDDLSFREYVPKKWRYRNKEEMIELIRCVLNEKKKDNVSKYVKKYDYPKVIGKLIKYLERW